MKAYVILDVTLEQDEIIAFEADTREGALATLKANAIVGHSYQETKCIGSVITVAERSALTLSRASAKEEPAEKKPSSKSRG